MFLFFFFFSLLLNTAAVSIFALCFKHFIRMVYDCGAIYTVKGIHTKQKTKRLSEKERKNKKEQIPTEYKEHIRNAWNPSIQWDCNAQNCTTSIIFLAFKSAGFDPRVKKEREETITDCRICMNLYVPWLNKKWQATLA